MYIYIYSYINEIYIHIYSLVFHAQHLAIFFRMISLRFSLFSHFFAALKAIGKEINQQLE